MQGGRLSVSSDAGESRLGNATRVLTVLLRDNHAMLEDGGLDICGKNTFARRIAKRHVSTWLECLRPSSLDDGTCEREHLGPVGWRLDVGGHIALAVDAPYRTEAVIRVKNHGCTRQVCAKTWSPRSVVRSADEGGWLQAW